MTRKNKRMWKQLARRYSECPLRFTSPNPSDNQRLILATLTCDQMGSERFAAAMKETLGDSVQYGTGYLSAAFK